MARNRDFLVLGLVSLWLSPWASVVGQTDAVAAPKEAGPETYVLVYLKSGPSVKEKSKEERTSIQAAHLANIQKLAREKKLVVAGPFGAVVHDKARRGIFILDVRTEAEARELTNTDPAVKEGVLEMELHPIVTSARLREALEAELKADADAKLEGRERPIAETIRAYVLVHSKSGTASEKFLSSKLKPAQVLFSATVDKESGFHLVDASKVDELKASLGEVLPSDLGLEFDEWWASRFLHTVHSKAR